jgi:hypothetical protein
MENLNGKSLAQSQASKTIAGVYGWMSVGVFLSACVGVGFVQSNALNVFLGFGRFALFGVFLAQIALVLGMTFAAQKLSSPLLKVLFLAYSSLTGITFAFLMTVYPLGNVIALFAVAALGFGVLALFGATTQRNLGFLGTFLIMGLFMIVGAGLINLFIQSEMLRSFAGWAGILVFSGLTAYDSQRIRQGAYELAFQRNLQSTQALEKFMIFGALTMYLNFINLFISLLQIFGGRKQ